MTRFSSSSHQWLSEQALVAHRTLVDIGVTSTTLYGCSGAQFLFTMGNTYTPFGSLGGIDSIQEESDPFPRGIKLWCKAVNSSDLYEPLREDMFNRSVIVYDAFIDPLTFTIVHTPEPVFSGKINEVDIRFGDPDRGNFYEITCETELRREPVIAYSNKETLWLTYSGDTFCNYQHLIPTFKSMWGQSPTRYVGGIGLNPQGGGRGGDGRGGGGRPYQP